MVLAVALIFIETNIKASEEYFEVREGVFWDMELDPDNWWVGLNPLSAGRHVIISDRSTDPELTGEDGFEYFFNFHLYGDKWSEEIADGSILPPGYDDYIQELSGGETENREEKGFTRAYRCGTESNL